MNKKGFTLVEILSVLVLIGLLLGLAIPGINKISSNMKKRSYSKKVSLVLSAAELWGQDNKTLLQSSNNCEIEDGEKVSCYKINIGNLIENNYLDSDKNSGEYISPLDNSDMKNQCVYVYKKNNRVYSYFAGEDGKGCVDDKTYESSLEAPNVITTDKVPSGGIHNDNTFHFIVKSSQSLLWKNSITKVKISDNAEYETFDPNKKYFSNKYNKTQAVSYYFRICNSDDKNECTEAREYKTTLKIPAPNLKLFLVDGSSETELSNYDGINWLNKSVKIKIIEKIGDGTVYFDNESLVDEKIFVNKNGSVEVKVCSSVDREDCSDIATQEIKIDKNAPIISKNEGDISLYRESNTKNYFVKNVTFNLSDGESGIKSYIIKDKTGNTLQTETFGTAKKTYNNLSYDFKTSGTITVEDVAGNKKEENVSQNDFISNYYFGPSSNIHNYNESAFPGNYIKISGAKHIRLVISTNEQVTYNASCSYSQVDGGQLGTDSGIIYPDVTKTIYVCNKSKSYNYAYITLKLCNQSNICKTYRWTNNGVTIDNVFAGGR